MKKTIALSTLVLASLSSSMAVYASEIKPTDSFGGHYISIFQSEVNLGDGLKGSGMGIRAGYKISDKWGLVGDASMFDTSGTISYQNDEIEHDLDGYMITAGPSYYFTPNLSVFVTAGVASYDSQQYTWGDYYTTQVFNPETMQLVNSTTRDKENVTKNNDKAFVYGIGFNYSIIESLAVNVMY